MVTQKMERRISPSEAAALFAQYGIERSPETVRRMCVTGELPGAMKIGKNWFIPPVDVRKITNVESD